MNTSTDAASAPVDTPVEVRLGASPHDREDAVRAAGAPVSYTHLTLPTNREV